MTTGRLPLAGTRVLELSHIVAGPAAGLVLADLGADVIRIERPDSDQARNLPSGAASVSQFLNRNKRSFAVDLKAPAGKAVFVRLVQSSDIVLDNFSPGVLERLGFGYEDLARVNPRIISLSVKGFLPGPYEDRPSLDEVAQMMGGLAFMTGPPGQPLRAGASIIDIGAASYGVIGVLAALLERERTGRGQKITSALFETTVFWVGQWVALAVATGEPSIPMPEMGQGQRMGWGIFRLFETSDGEQMFVAVTSDAHWERFCKEFGLLDLLADERLSSNAKRVAARQWLLPRVREELRKYSAAELQGKLARAELPYAPLRRPDQLLDDPHLNETNQFMLTPFPGRGTGKLPKLPFRSSDYEFSLRRPVPGLGEHTRELLEELGHNESEIERLVSAKAVLIGIPSERADGAAGEKS